MSPDLPDTVSDQGKLTFSPFEELFAEPTPHQTVPPHPLLLTSNRTFPASGFVATRGALTPSQPITTSSDNNNAANLAVQTTSTSLARADHPRRKRLP
jgi:hypothetical protein